MGMARDGYDLQYGVALFALGNDHGARHRGLSHAMMFLSPMKGWEMFQVEIHYSTQGATEIILKDDVQSALATASRISIDSDVYAVRVLAEDGTVITRFYVDLREDELQVLQKLMSRD